MKSKTECKQYKDIDKKKDVECKKGVGEKCTIPNKPKKTWMYLFFRLLALLFISAFVVFYIYKKEKTKINVSILPIINS